MLTLDKKQDLSIETWNAKLITFSESGYLSFCSNRLEVQSKGNMMNSVPNFVERASQISVKITVGSVAPVPW